MRNSLFIITFAAIGNVFAEETEESLSPSSARFWGQILAIIFLIMLSGIVAGLTLGLMTLDTTNLDILQIAGTTQQQYYASRIIPIRKNGHILLITMLLTNTVLNETLPILFDSIFSKGFISVIVSTALLVLFSEIIPQAIFTKHSLAIGAAFAFPVRVLIGFWFVIAWPISKFLDSLLGAHAGSKYSAPELSALVELHDSSKQEKGSLRHETANMLQNILDFQGRTITHVMTPVSDMLLLPSDTVLDRTTTSQYNLNGFTHIFVYANQHADEEVKDIRILGVIDIKTLSSMEDKDLKCPLGRMSLDLFTSVSSRTSTIKLFDDFLHKNSRNQVALVYRTEEDIQFCREERLKKETELKIVQETQLKKHLNGLRCRLYKFTGYGCKTCFSMTTSSETTYTNSISEKYTIEEEEGVSQSSSSATIDTDMEPSLLGMVTLNDILSLLVDGSRLNGAGKTETILDFTSIPMKQVTL
ncbi:DUF21-domain-containing protein [Backusella circina FSU 941]|nr:DUF21-domain-containing protein [Backusella circina FSU 941]